MKLNKKRNEVTQENTYNTVLNPEFRKHCDKFLSDLVADTLAQNSRVAASMKSFSRELFIRSTIESVLRIEDAQNQSAGVRAFFGSGPSPVQAVGYIRSRRGIARTLVCQGLARARGHRQGDLRNKAVVRHRTARRLSLSNLSRRRANGCGVECVLRRVGIGLDTAGMAGRYGKVVGHEATRGARSHLGIDDTDHHVDLAWNMCMRMIKTPEDQIRFKRHLVRLHSLLVAYIVEVADVVAGENSKAAEAGAAVAAIDVSMPAQALN
jgi:hypothetical protein